MARHILRFLLLFLILLFSASYAAAFPYAPKQGEVWLADILINGDDVGDSTIAFSYDNKGYLHVLSVSECKVKMAFITVFRMKTRTEEVWDGNHLVSMDFEGTFNDEKQWGHIRRQSSGQLVSEGPNGKQTVDGNQIPFATWTPYIYKRDQFIRPVENDLISMKLERGKWEDITIYGKAVRAIKLTTPSDENGGRSELWYDKAGRWLRTDLVSANGAMTFVRKSIERQSTSR